MKVRDIAEKGQVDLGLDYAWLDDVTYNDWQRYHGLIQGDSRSMKLYSLPQCLMAVVASDNFAHEAASIQNGTHTNGTASNPVVPVIEDIESEMKDIVIGFETRLRRIKRDGERAFNNGNGNGSTPPKEEDKVPAPEPEVSILPVPDITGNKPGKVVPPVIIGRSKEEVLEALKKVERHDGQESIPVAKGGIDPEEAVSSLVRQAEGEGHSAVPRTEL